MRATARPSRRRAKTTMRFNDAEWRRRSSERMKAMHADPAFKDRVRRGVAASHLDKDTMVARSNPGSHPGIRAWIVEKIDEGWPRDQVADYWAMSVGRINHIYSEAKRGVNSRGKPRVVL